MFKVGDRVAHKDYPNEYGIIVRINKFSGMVTVKDDDGSLYDYFTRNIVHEPTDLVIDYKIALAEEMCRLLIRVPDAADDCALYFAEHGMDEYYELYAMAALISGVFEGGEE